MGHHARLVANMVKGVSAGYTKTMEITGTGYRAAVQGAEPGDQPRLLARRRLSGPGRHHDHHAAADRDHGRRAWTSSRSARSPPKSAPAVPPEPYKGKGVRYDNETIRRKEGKKK